MKTIATYKGHQIQMNSSQQVVCDDLTVLRSFCYSQIALKKGTPVLAKGVAARIAAAIKSGKYDARPDAPVVHEMADLSDPKEVARIDEEVRQQAMVPPARAAHVKMSYGQCGPALSLTTAELSDKERAVFDSLCRIRGELTIGDLAVTAFPQLSAVQANSWTRNSLRRLVRASLVHRVREGVYAAASN